MDCNFDHQMYLSESKCWFSNNCSHFLKRAVPLIGGNWLGAHQGDQIGLVSANWAYIWVLIGIFKSMK
jgi:hypothetical protein